MVGAQQSSLCTKLVQNCCRSTTIHRMRMLVGQSSKIFILLYGLNDIKLTLWAFPAEEALTFMYPNETIYLAKCFLCLMKYVSLSYLTGYDIPKHWGYVGKSSLCSRRNINLSEGNQWGFYSCSERMEKIAGTISLHSNIFQLPSSQWRWGTYFYRGREVWVQRLLIFNSEAPDDTIWF